MDTVMNTPARIKKMPKPRRHCFLWSNDGCVMRFSFSSTADVVFLLFLVLAILGLKQAQKYNFNVVRENIKAVYIQLI